MSTPKLHKTASGLALVSGQAPVTASAGFNLEYTERGISLSWDEAEHPRWPAGDERGGEFRGAFAGLVEKMVKEHGVDPFVETEFFGGSDSFVINDYFRKRAYGGVEDIDPETKRHADAIERYLEEFKLERDVVAYRGVNGNALDAINFPRFSDATGWDPSAPMPDNWMELYNEQIRGIRFVDAGVPFVSTDIRQASVHGYPERSGALAQSSASDRGGAIFRMHLKKGDPGLDEERVYDFNGEREIALPTNRMFTIMGIAVEDGRQVIDVEVSDGKNDPEFRAYLKILAVKKILHDLELRHKRLEAIVYGPSYDEDRYDALDAYDQVRSAIRRYEDELEILRASTDLNLADVRTDMAPGGNPYHDKGGKFTTKIKAVPKKIPVDWLVERLPGATDAQLDEIWRALPNDSVNRRSLVRDEKVRRMRAQGADAKLESFREKAPQDGALVKDRLDFMLGIKSAQSGGVIVDDGQYSHYAGKYDYATNTAHVSTVTMNSPEEYWNAQIHEQLHGHSAGSHSKINLYKILDNPELEEGVVEGATRAFRPRILEHARTMDPSTFAMEIPNDSDFENLDRSHPYNSYVEPLDAKADEMGIPRDEFYRKLLGMPVDKRAEFLKVPLRGESGGVKNDSKRVVQKDSPKGHKMGDTVNIDGVDYVYDGMEHTGTDAWVRPKDGGKRKRVPVDALPDASGAQQEAPKQEPNVDTPSKPSEDKTRHVAQRAIEEAFVWDGGGTPHVVFTEAMKNVDSVHAYPSHSNYAYVKRGGVQGGDMGHYKKIKGSNYAPEIAYSEKLKGPAARATLYHEMGHFMDDALWRGSSTRDHAFTLAKAFRESPAMKRWKSSPMMTLRKDDQDYYFSGTEIFARAYSQYIAEKSGDTEALDHLEKGRAQWRKDEFRPVAEAFDAVLKDLGLLKEKPEKPETTTPIQTPSETPSKDSSPSGRTSTRAPKAEVPVDGKPDAGTGKVDAPSAPAVTDPGPGTGTKKFVFSETFDASPPSSYWKGKYDTPVNSNWRGDGEDRPAGEILKDAGLDISTAPSRAPWQMRMDMPKMPSDFRPSPYDKKQDPSLVQAWADYDEQYKKWLGSLNDAEFVSYVGTYVELDRYSQDQASAVELRKRLKGEDGYAIDEMVGKAIVAFGSNPIANGGRERTKAAGQKPGTRVNENWYDSAMNPNSEHTAAGYLVKWAGDKGMTPEEAAAKLTQDVRDALKTAKIASRVSPGTLDKILRSGRFKTQFETTKSGGRFDREMRANHEQMLFGYPTNLPPEQRPFYGYLTGDDEVPYDPESDLTQYGDVIVYFNEDTKKRTTVMGDDSLPYNSAEAVPLKWDEADWRVAFGPGRKPSPFTEKLENNASGNKSFNRRDGGGMKGWMSYAEAQIHEGTTTDDIEKVVLPYSQPKLEALLRKKGIQYEIRGEPADAFIHDAIRTIATNQGDDPHGTKAKNIERAQAKIDAVKELEKKGELPEVPDVWSASGDELRQYYIQARLASVYSDNVALGMVWSIIEENAHGVACSRWRESEGEGYTWISPENVRKKKGDNMIATLRKMYPELKQQWPWLPTLETIISDFYTKKGFKKS